MLRKGSRKLLFHTIDPYTVYSVAKGTVNIEKGLAVITVSPEWMNRVPAVLENLELTAGL